MKITTYKCDACGHDEKTDREVMRDICVPVALQKNSTAPDLHTIEGRQADVCFDCYQRLARLIHEWWCGEI